MSENKLATRLSSDASDDTRLGRNVIALGWVAFFGGLAQDMIQPVLPTFLTTVLGLSKEFIGLIEGSLTTIVSLMKIGAGYLSDALGLRKAIVFVGYAFSALARFSLGFVGSGAGALGLRLTDGVGKGLKDAPRDALVAGSAGGRRLGFAFGVSIGVMALPASLIAGTLWTRVPPAAPFAFGAAMAFAAFIGLRFVPALPTAGNV